ncbi:MAG: C40 family peptidase, partial [Desulfovibrionaceae bacterium]|nr:C40 family peptidase [Desulfovibrionaceae bacterium]
MGIRYTLLALALVCLMVSGCAKKHPQPEPEANPMVIKFEKFRQTYDSSTYKAENSEFDLSSGADDDNVEYAPASISGPNSGVTSIVLARAHRSIGTPYVFGGTQPGGFDCSGLVQWAYKGAGIRLPRTAREQSQAGFGIRNRSQMRAGDIVAFRRRSGGGYHTGIYIGDGKFIHAPRRNKRVRIESMETGYFARNFIGARRVDTSNRSTELALATEKADRQYTARKSKSSKSKVARTGVSKKSSKATASRKAQASRNKVQASRTKA